MSTPRRIIVIKKYRPKNDQLRDIPLSFGPLTGLHLDLLENKKKLKKGLPAIYVEPKIVQKPVSKIDSRPKEQKVSSVTTEKNSHKSKKKKKLSIHPKMTKKKGMKTVMTTMMKKKKMKTEKKMEKMEITNLVKRKKKTQKTILVLMMKMTI